MKQRGKSQVRLICTAFAGLLLLLALLLWQGIRRGDAARVGIPRSAAAYGAASLVLTPTAQYHCTVGSTALALSNALRQGELDAALLPYEVAASLEGCEIRAVVGYESLVIVSRQDIAALSDLNGQTITLQQKLAGSRAEAMLRTVLSEERIACGIAYGDAGEPFACDLDTAAALLSGDSDLRICLSVSKEWRSALPSYPPAGLCLVARQEYLAHAGSDFTAFERALRGSMQYSDEKRKKTVAMAVSAGFAADADLADAVYPWCDFIWLTGAEMNASLAAGK